MVLKKGSPIEMLPSPSSLCTSGSSVPSSTTSMAAISRILLLSRNDSRDHSECSTRARTRPPLMAYSSSEPPMAMTSSARINSPRVGSEAKAWTETSTPERTRKVPSRHSEKAEIASSTVQARKLPRFSVTASECSSAVPTSHGIKGGVLHRVPEPPAAPAQLVVGPRRPEDDAKGQENPRCLGPRPRPARPRRIQPPGQQRRDGESKSHRETNVAHIEDRRMEDHADILQQRIKIPAIDGIQRQRAG
ncbi:Uncharacterised protein [Raoultella terrigena]|uniref:Uncharacterized protein n=1 Tax=Raoultella terrigena TaxID=577 RepID=A0A4V6J1A7_RAOTE|nr:Uncharacterised protein [Raoultella terrigena]